MWSVAMPIILVALLTVAVAAPSIAAPAIAAAATSKKCLTNREIRGKDISAENGYFARTSRGWWRNAAACPAFGSDRALTTRSNTNSQCSGDLVTVFHPFSRIEYGGCVLGDWEKVAGPPA